METNVLFTFYSVIHDEGIVKLSTILTILSIAFIAILILLARNIIKTRKLKDEIKRLKKQ